MASRTYQVDDFDSIQVAGSYGVKVRTGIPLAVRAEGDSDALENLEILADGGKLRIGDISKLGLWAGTGKTAVTIYVDVPSLRRASLAGSGGMQIDAVEGENFKASIAGSGDLRVDRLEVDSAKFSMAGSGNVLAVGRVDQARASIAGSGSANLAGLESRRAKVSIAGSGNVQAHAAETAKVSLVGSGNVRITGGARCEVNRMGSGRVHCD